MRRPLAAILLIQCLPGRVAAFGPEGHLIAGLAAEPYLCAAASAAVDDLADEPFAELGWWADRIRDDERYRRTAPWHYMNVPDTAGVADYRHPPEGDVLWAIEHFAARLADANARRSERAEALRFLVHFVVDIHQPLHVGRAGDRGGNAIDVRYGSVVVNLHRFWDTDAIRLAGLTPRAYAARIRARAGAAVRGDLDPEAWAEESLALRPEVYAFDESGRLDEHYLRSAREITESRLGLAAGRLAGILNSIFCK
jgi:nuclease S1